MSPRETAATLAAKHAIQAAVDSAAIELIDLSHAIHADPETAFEEHHAAERITSLLAASSYRVARGVGRLATAFRADLNNQQPAIGICAEYDALPNLGHGCGHNIIAAIATGAALALARGPSLPGNVAVIGTPAEEGGGGKVLLLEAGVFRGLDAALMIHPGTRNFVDRGSLASTRVEIAYTGREAHADAPPGSGINALDAVLHLFSGANLLRSTMRPDARIHGIIVDGGERPTIIPGRAVAHFSVRAADRQYATELVARLRRVAEGAALATGAECEITVARSYENMVPNHVIARTFGANLARLGRKVTPTTGNERTGSTDMGNVSQALPAIHGYLAIAEPGASGHSVAFREAACSPRGDVAVLDGAKAIAMTVYDLLTEPGLLDEAKAEFAEQRAAGRVVGIC